MIVEKEYSYLVEYPDPELHSSKGATWPKVKEPQKKTKHDWSWIAWVIIGLAVLITCLSSCGQEAWAGEVQHLTASYYSRASLVKEGTAKYNPKFLMANGKVFYDERFTSACNSYPIGVELCVTNGRNGKSVVVFNTDRTAKRFKGKRIDLSISAMAKIGDVERGLEKVTVTEIGG